MSDSKIPTPDQLRRDVNEFLKEKYGDRVVVPPEPDLNGQTPPPEGEKKEFTSPVHFNLKPSELEAYLQQYVVGQDEAIEVLATKICTHFNRMKLETRTDGVEELVGNIKSNVLMIGPTGVGKTYLIKLIAKKIGVPFVKGDATKFSETGYVGGDVEELVRDLVREANGDLKLAEYGIIYLDEIDKIASSGNSIGPDVSRSGVQRNLLKLMEESEVDLKTPHDLAAQMEAAMEAQRTGKVARKKVNTRNILFVMSGAFSTLPDIIRRRLNQQPIGFRGVEEELPASAADTEILRKLRSEDLIRFGFESEFVGRLPVTVTLNDLDVEGLFRILGNPNSTVIQGKRRDFRSYDIHIEFEEEALRRIAELANEEHTGARGLVSVVDRLLLKFEKTLPDTTITEFTVTPALVDNPQGELDRLLTQHYLKAFQKRFLASNGIVITFTGEALELLRQRASGEGKNLEEVCSDLLHDYEYGLRLLGCDNFTVDSDIVRDPKSRLEEMIKQSYGKKH
ncbi:MAG: ATP-dependent Clp protease ATP-binding subunit ClpX [bacterium ADurb.Bin431]|nr:MAG: ATP-dependent Clp protease ATP-binding subunit ClpX [bacterium ADurb.Bin431]HOC23737.1 AAA family ATPase [bacterium]HPG83307.1 AAA family ATPase [bacterium]HPM58909.1 AAA family ATPase [bacterium]